MSTNYTLKRFWRTVLKRRSEATRNGRGRTFFLTLECGHVVERFGAHKGATVKRADCLQCEAAHVASERLAKAA